MSAEATVAPPTVPGYYESEHYPLAGDYLAYRLDSDGQWFMGEEEYSETLMRTLMPLTRLVPVTDLAEQIDVSSFAELLSGFMSRDAGLAQHQEAALHILREIREGRMNK